MGGSKPGTIFRILSVPAGIAGLLLLLLYMGGVFSTDTIPPGATVVYENAVQDLFGRQTFGALRFTSGRRLLISSRIYSQAGAEADDSAGQFFAGVPAGFAIGAGEATELIGAHQTQPADASDFRFNFGFVEVTGGGSCEVKVTVRDRLGTTLGTRSYTLGRWQAEQRSFRGDFPSLSSTTAS